MNEQQKKNLVFGSILVLIVILGALLYKCDDKENYKACVCSSNNGGRRENCQDVDLVDTAYNSGVLTEYTNLVAPGWSTVSPGDYDFPEDAGCSSSVPKKGVIQWQPWDYSDLAG